MPTTPLPPLAPLELRILGVLVEKQLATPDYYPLTLNALVAGCNQKTSRNPVMSVAEREVQVVLDDLRSRTLVIETSGGRAMRYEHNVNKVLGIGEAMVALLAALMLRGPLTAAELRGACDRLYRFADVSSVEAYLEDMITRAALPLVVKLPKQPGSREHRWAHLLAGPVDTSSAPAPAMEVAGGTSEDVAELRADVAELREELAALRALVETMRG
ncbi:MAG: YceH family protein [Burkholderiales bacterium]|nr:YceH family protein [Burkholderiales bacterium]